MVNSGLKGLNGLMWLYFNQNLARSKNLRFQTCFETSKMSLEIIELLVKEIIISDLSIFSHNNSERTSELLQQWASARKGQKSNFYNV